MNPEDKTTERIKVYGTREGKLYIKPSELFSLKKVQDLVMKIASRHGR